MKVKYVADIKLEVEEEVEGELIENPKTTMDNNITKLLEDEILSNKYKINIQSKLFIDSKGDRL